MIFLCGSFHLNFLCVLYHCCSRICIFVFVCASDVAVHGLFFIFSWNLFGFVNVVAFFLLWKNKLPKGIAFITWNIIKIIASFCFNVFKNTLKRDASPLVWFSSRWLHYNDHSSRFPLSIRLIILVHLSFHSLMQSCVWSPCRYFTLHILALCGFHVTDGSIEYIFYNCQLVLVTCVDLSEASSDIVCRHFHDTPEAK